MTTAQERINARKNGRISKDEMAQLANLTAKRMEAALENGGYINMQVMEIEFVDFAVASVWNKGAEQKIVAAFYEVQSVDDTDEEYGRAEGMVFVYIDKDGNPKADLC